MENNMMDIKNQELKVNKNLLVCWFHILTSKSSISSSGENPASSFSSINMSPGFLLPITKILPTYLGNKRSYIFYRNVISVQIAVGRTHTEASQLKVHRV